MNELIKKEILAFETLQRKYDTVGAEDSEPSYIFQLVIAYAITKDPVDVHKPIEWELFCEDVLAEDGFESLIPVVREAADSLTNQAWKVYEVIQKIATSDDILDLRKYCWRLDDAEFMSWNDLGNKP